MSIVGIGQDLIEIERIRQALHRHGERFLSRCYTPAEIQYCQAFKDPVPEFAARFAAKEAAAKALGTGISRGVFWRDFETLRQPGHPPNLTFHRGALARAKQLSVSTVHVTMTHARDLAGAVVIIEN